MVASNSSEAFQRVVGELRSRLDTGVGITVEGETVLIHGDLNMSGVQLALKLPRFLTVEGNCNLANMGLTDDDMPEELFVGGSLCLAGNSAITQSPKKGAVGVDIDLQETGIKHIFADFVLDDSLGSAAFMPDGESLRSAVEARQYLEVV